jgi:hypothetical protein
MYKVQCFLFCFASVLLLERRQLDTLLVSLHSSICFLQRTVKHALFRSVCFVSRKGIVCIYHGKRTGAALLAPTHPRLGVGG